MTDALGWMNEDSERTRALVLATTEWVTWVGGDATQADAQIYYESAPPDAPYPHCIIDLDGNQVRTRDGVRLKGFIGSGGVFLYFCDRAQPGKERDAVVAFRAQVSAVMLALEKLYGVPGLLRYDLVAGPRRIRSKERAVAQDEYEVAFGLDYANYP